MNDTKDKLDDKRENYSSKIVIDNEQYDLEKIGEGTSCVCYEITSKGRYHRHKIKEFYPLTILGVKKEIPLHLFEGGKSSLADVEISAYEKRFESFLNQASVIDSVSENWQYQGGNMLEEPVKIDTSLGVCYDYGKNSGIVLSAYIRDNLSEEDDFKKRLIEGLRIVYYACLDLKRYHPTHINLDIKPSNLLYIPINNRGDFSAIRNFDFSSCVSIDSLEKASRKKSARNIIKEYIFSTQQFYDKSDIEDTIDECIENSFDEKSRQRLLRLDIMALIKLLFYALDPKLREIPIDQFEIEESLKELFFKNDFEIWGVECLLSRFDIYCRLLSLVKNTFSSDMDIDQMITEVVSILSILCETPFVTQGVTENIARAQDLAIATNLTLSREPMKYPEKESSSETQEANIKSDMRFLIENYSEKKGILSATQLYFEMKTKHINKDIVPRMMVRGSSWNNLKDCYTQILDSLRSANQLILGDASMGKSTLVDYIEVTLVSSGKSARVINCNHYDEAEFLKEKKNYPSDTVWIFDGFEEITDTSGRKQREIIELVRKSKNIILASRYNPVTEEAKYTKVNGVSKETSPAKYLFDSTQICTLMPVDDDRIKKVYGVSDPKALPPIFKTTMFMSLYLDMTKEYGNKIVLSVDGKKTINHFVYKNETIFIRAYFEQLEKKKNTAYSGSIKKDILFFGEQAYKSLCRMKIESFYPCPALARIYGIDGQRVVASQQTFLNYALAEYLLTELLKKDKNLNELLSLNGKDLPKIYYEALHYVGQLLKFEEKGAGIIRELNKLKKNVSTQFLCAVLIYSGYNDKILDHKSTTAEDKGKPIFSSGNSFSRLVRKHRFFEHNRFVETIDDKFYKGLNERDFENSSVTRLFVDRKRVGTYSFAGLPITSVIFGAKVKKIKPLAFAECDKLQFIGVSKENKYLFSSNDTKLFLYCVIDKKKKSLVLGCPKTIIPDDGSVTKIARDCFEGRDLEGTISIPNFVKLERSKRTRRYIYYDEVTGKAMPEGKMCYLSICNNCRKIEYPTGEDNADNDAEEIAEYVGQRHFINFISKYVSIKPLARFFVWFYYYINTEVWNCGTANYELRRFNLIHSCSFTNLFSIVVLASQVWFAFNGEMSVGFLMFFCAMLLTSSTMLILMRVSERVVGGLLFKCQRKALEKGKSIVIYFCI